jgi:hypothetical protein
MPQDVKERLPWSGNDIIMQYFKCIDKRDVDGALELFDFDAIIYEPFSNITDGLRGKLAIEPFLKVAMMANSNFKRVIEIEKNPTKKDTISALITFEKGDRTKGRFTFEFTPGEPGNGKKIKSLHIQF